MHAQLPEVRPVSRTQIEQAAIALGRALGDSRVLVDPDACAPYANDESLVEGRVPDIVVVARSAADVATTLALALRHEVPVTPRAAGTGRTGGAMCVGPGIVLATHALTQVKEIDHENLLAVVQPGVITGQLHATCEAAGLFYPPDPNSCDTCMIGGNIAENAGGKLAVRWGTCIDNLLEWRISIPNGQRWTVRRTNHQFRKILPQDLVTFEVVDEQDAPVKQIELKGTEIRKKGLWKDITNKTLGGLPGMQKEGTDGIITSAVFVLYPAYQAKKTLCLEFFGPDFEEASHVILELARAFPFPRDNEETLLALEHFDDEYIRAIGYKVKAARAQTPKAVLLIDVAGDSPEQAGRGVERVRALLQQHPNTVLFVARDSAEATRFWADRKKLGAIARRTNAFKMNEDIVLPLEALAEFAHFVDDVNILEERFSQRTFADRAEEIVANLMSPEVGAVEGEQATAQNLARLELCAQFREQVLTLDPKTLRSLAALNEFRKSLERLMRGYPEVLAALDRAFREVRDRRIVLATHMHAGDGNVHVNVPVLSNDRPMLHRTDQRIDDVMAKVIALNGVVSGEHGIGVTKLKYIDPAIIAELTAYRKEIDPHGLMNPGKLEDYQALGHIFTPSFNLLELEADILQHGQLEELSRMIAHCVRCGKCKPDCCVNYPGRGMFFHPRNKNLAIGSLIEAMLYDAQRKLSAKFELMPWLEEVADHCTICHKCLAPCPVDIDSGKVSILEREILSSWGYKHTPIATKLTLSYLDSHSPAYNSIFRAGVVRMGGAAQRLGHKLAAPLQKSAAFSQLYPVKMLRSSLPPVPSQTLRDVLPKCEQDQALVFEPVQPEGASAQELKTVFYFPGCGSERLFSDVSMAAIHMLLEVGTRVVLPPPFLCCGFPAHANAKTAQHSSIVLRDSILFNQMREMFANLDFDACIVTCGTCREGLAGMNVQNLFQRIVDVSAYMSERGLRLEGDGTYLYHAPCHDSLEGKANPVLNKIGGFGSVTPVAHCCSEAGTLSLSRPDITDSMLHRKREELVQVLANVETNAEKDEKRIVLTNCPSCLQGLGRSRDLGITPTHIAVALAEKHSGPEWKKKFLLQAGRASAVSF